jgi:hypothetical protein
VAEQLPAGARESLRQFLRDGLDRETIKAAIERSLAGGNESARVAAVKFLADLELYRQDGDEEDRIAAGQKAAAEAREYLSRELARPAPYEEQRLIEELAAGDSERARRILAALAAQGQLVPREDVVRMAEEMATERLEALKQEHGLVGV